MKAEIVVNNSSKPDANYLTWAPSPLRVRMTTPIAELPRRQVTLRAKRKAGGGDLVFYANLAAGATPKRRIVLTLPMLGTSVSCFVAGRFGAASKNFGDVEIEVVAAKKVIARLPVMVRIRKDATKLSASERDRFVSALAVLNNRGTGRFVDFRNMHVNAASPEAHGGAGFLPWHRAYLLDLERELQAIDPNVAMPYWRFDRPAAAVFKPNFMGASDPIGTVSFSAGNPLQFWSTDGVPGINRRPFFLVGTQSPSGLLDELQTIALGNSYSGFRVMEGNPHGSAHTSFGGFISSIGTAARDPLFFMLHANVDRLWAKWQHQRNRFDPSLASAYDSGGAGGNRVGHNLTDTMWPWNGVTTPPRPSTAPGGAFAASSIVTAPGLQPHVRDELDYQGRFAVADRLGFDYDDVPFVL